MASSKPARDLAEVFVADSSDPDQTRGSVRLATDRSHVVVTSDMRLRIFRFVPEGSRLIFVLDAD